MATARNAFLINTSRPDLAVSNIFQVSEGAVRIAAHGIESTDYVKLEKQVSPASGTFAATWTEVIRQGQAVRLSQNNIEHIELITGIYRVVRVGVASANIVVHMQEDQTGLDSRLMYTLPAYNPTFNGSVTGTGLSPALVSSRDRTGYWSYDIGAKKYIWVEANVDTSTGAVTYTYFDSPGGAVAVPSVPIGAPISYPSNERLFFATVTSAGGAFDLDGFAPGHAVKKVTILVDAGQFTLSGLSGAILVDAGESFEFAVTADMGKIENTGPSTPYLLLTPVNVGGDSARVIVQACRVSPE